MIPKSLFLSTVNLTAVYLLKLNCTLNGCDICNEMIVIMLFISSVHTC